MIDNTMHHLIIIIVVLVLAAAARLVGVGGWERNQNRGYILRGAYHSFNVINGIPPSSPRAIFLLFTSSMALPNLRCTPRAATGAVSKS